MILAAVVIAVCFAVMEFVSHYYKMTFTAKILWALLLAALSYCIFLLWLAYAVTRSISGS